MEEKVKYFNYLEKERLERIFYKQPQEFDKKTDKDILKYALGAFLYIPANKYEQIYKSVVNQEKEAKPLATFIASQGAEQCGFCNPGFMMNTLALLKENPHPSDDEIKEFLAGNLCRCSGYEGQLRGIKNYLNYLEEKGNE